jgi:hypothetical protein
MASENTPGAYVGLLAEHDSKMLFHSKVPTLLKGQYHTNIIAGFNKSMDRIGLICSGRMMRWVVGAIASQNNNICKSRLIKS